MVLIMLWHTLIYSLSWKIEDLKRRTEMFLIFMIGVNLEKYDNFKMISFTFYQLLDLFAQGQATTL